MRIHPLHQFCLNIGNRAKTLFEQNGAELDSLGPGKQLLDHSAATINAGGSTDIVANLFTHQCSPPEGKCILILAAQHLGGHQGHLIDINVRTVEAIEKNHAIDGVLIKAAHHIGKRGERGTHLEAQRQLDLLAGSFHQGEVLLLDGRSIHLHICSNHIVVELDGIGSTGGKAVCILNPAATLAAVDRSDHRYFKRALGILEEGQIRINVPFHARTLHKAIGIGMGEIGIIDICGRLPVHLDLFLEN